MVNLSCGDRGCVCDVDVSMIFITNQYSQNVVNEQQVATQVIDAWADQVCGILQDMS